MLVAEKTIATKARENIKKITKALSQQETEKYDLLILLTKYMIDLYEEELKLYQNNHSITQILNRTILETHLYILYLTSDGQPKYQIRKKAYKLISSKQNVQKILNALYNDSLIDINNHKDITRRENARKIAKTNEEILKNTKTHINECITDFFKENDIDLSLKKFKNFYSITKNKCEHKLANLHDLAIYVGEGELYNLIMSQTSQRVHATAIYNEYTLDPLEKKTSIDDAVPKSLNALLIKDDLKKITSFLNKKSLFDKKIERLMSNVITN